MFVLTFDTVLRLSVAFFLGGVIGLERELTRKPAGFRTHILISLASALFTLISLSPVFAGPTHDPARVAAQILTGMGFVGAGVVIGYGGQVRGVTTAASLWITAAVGMAAGLGEYGIAVFSTFLILLALWGLKLIEKTTLAQLEDNDKE